MPNETARADEPEIITADVVVIGSGSAGIAAALTAAKGGASVIVLEKSHLLGGTSAMSGAGTWVPGNHLMLAEGISDSPEETLTYLRACAPEGWQATEDKLWRAFSENSGKMLTFIEANTPLEFAITHEADPFAEYPGGKRGGRTLSPKLLSRNILGRYKRKLRGSTLPHIFTYQELAHDIQRRFFKTVFRMAPVLLWRWLTNQRGQGSALMTGLIRGALDAGCRLELKASARRLLTDAEGLRITGVEVEQDGKVRHYMARRAVLLATGGFEWDEEMRKQHFPGPVDYIGSPRTNTGDGQRMAAAVGAQLAHMDQANMTSLVPTLYEGRLHGIPLQFHTVPNAILVNREGKRFVSEFRFNLGEIIDARDANGQPLNLPVWLISDGRFFGKSGLLRWFAMLDRKWVTRASSIRELARKLKLPEAAFEDTVNRYNGFAIAGRDDDFKRGQTPLEAERAAVSGLMEPIVKAPFIAIPFNRSFLGTKGGARTNEAGQVLRADGSIIAGLYCAGIAMASPFGTRAVGSGTTIGPNMTWGYICANHILRQNA